MSIKIRNICIIAHVDHGKTTLVDHILKQAGTFGSHGDTKVPERAMDSMDIERERGITIAAKNAAITLGDTKVNIVDTPGHADFGGEVERIMGMVDGGLLLVDAGEGPLPQTRFVLEKALATGLRLILVINKVDRPEASKEQIGKVVDKTFDLFCELGADDEQADFPILYACAKDGWCTTDLDAALSGAEGNAEIRGTGLKPLFELILNDIPAPIPEDGPGFRMQVANLDYSEYVGQLAVGRVLRGQVERNAQICRHGMDDSESPMQERFQAARLYGYEGMKRVETDAIQTGDIAIIAGCNGFEIGDTLTAADLDADDCGPLPRLAVEKPTLGMIFSVNTSPTSGQEGEAIQSRKLRDILERECRANVALKLEETEQPDQVRLLGRGELQFAVLIEQFRREGYEFMVGRPIVLYRQGEGGLEEPLERTTLDLPEGAAGEVTEMLQKRKGLLQGYDTLSSGRVRLTFEIPTRGLLGVQSQFLTATRGEGLFSSEFAGYTPHKGDIPHRHVGALISDRSGETVEYAIRGLEDRGVLFCKPGVKVYEGMIIGECARENDLNVNPCKEKKLTNVRSVNSDVLVHLQGIKQMPLERCLEWIDDDEWIEVTPESIRMRKKVLAKNMRSVRREDRIP